jgi:biopolymer transport protein ExbD
MFSRFPSVPAPTTRTFVEAWLYPKRREGLPCPPAAGASAEARHSSHHHPSRGVSYHSIRSSACRPPTPQNTSVNQPNSFRMRTYAKRSNNPFRIALTKIPRGRGNHLTTIPNRYRRTLARPNPPCSSHLGPVSARGLRQICPPQPKPGAPSPAAAADFLTGIDTSPFLAIFLVLYIIFSTVPRHSRFTPVDLPIVGHAVSQPAAVRNDSLQLTVRRDGNLFVAANDFFPAAHVAPDQLASRLQPMIQPDTERRVYIRADARARYSDVERVLDAIRSTGIEDVTFIAELKTSPTQPSVLPPTPAKN